MTLIFYVWVTLSKNSTNLEHLVDWLNANKISSNVKKIEMAIFKFKQKKFESNLKIKLCGKRLYPTESVKYLGVKIDTKLSWQYLVNDVSIISPWLNRANALLFKMIKYVSLKILRSICFAIFDYYLSYCCLVWAQRNSQTSSLFKQSSISKFHDKTFLENILFVNKSLNNLTPPVFNI